MFVIKKEESSQINHLTFNIKTLEKKTIPKTNRRYNIIKTRMEIENGKYRNKSTKQKVGS